MSISSKNCSEIEKDTGKTIHFMEAIHSYFLAGAKLDCPFSFCILFLLLQIKLIGIFGESPQKIV